MPSWAPQLLSLLRPASGPLKPALTQSPATLQLPPGYLPSVGKGSPKGVAVCPSHVPGGAERGQVRLHLTNMFLHFTPLAGFSLSADHLASINISESAHLFCFAPANQDDAWETNGGAHHSFSGAS